MAGRADHRAPGQVCIFARTRLQYVPGGRFQPFGP